MHEIIDRFGKEAFKSGLGQLLDYAENQARAVIRDIPDGEYFFADYADEDQAGGYPGPHRGHAARSTATH